ncbi:cupredoxin domain-containing protein [Candidatus Woesearchaeota archaeon]|nr:cupredoxin domain-containing protein [Candidatus Woesearchaeota archaeon]
MVRCNQCGRDFGTEEALAMHNAAKHYVYKQKKNYNKGMLWWVGGIIVIVVIAWYISGNNNSLKSTVVDGEDNNKGEIQKITLSLKNFNYYPTTITVKEGLPVEIKLDDSIKGCYRTFVIKDLGVNAYSKNPSEVIQFVPKQKGTFEFVCGMRMGRGTIVVE